MMSSSNSVSPLSVLIARKEARKESSNVENFASFGSRESFERARSFDIDKFYEDNKKFLNSENLEDKKNACAAYLVVKFGLWVGFSKRFVRGSTWEEGFHEFTYGNLEVTMGNNRCELSMKFYDSLKEDELWVYERKDFIDMEVGAAIEEVMEIAYDGKSVAKRAALVFNSWKEIHSYMHSVNSCVKPFEIRSFQASTIAEDILAIPENNVKGSNMKEVQEVLSTATSAAATFLGHTTSSTVKRSYIDPRIIVEWLKRNGHQHNWVLRSEIFQWAIDEIKESTEPFRFAQKGLTHQNLTLEEYLCEAMEKKCDVK